MSQPNNDHIAHARTMLKRRAATKREKDAEGRPLCKVCQTALTGRRTSYCSDECALRNNPGWMRHAVYRRDKGICAMCGVDTTKLSLRPNYWGSEHEWEADHILAVAEGGGLCGLEGYRTLCRSCHGKESGALRKRLNERKRLEKLQRETGKLF
jgi:hypothetical protein